MGHFLLFSLIFLAFQGSAYASGEVDPVSAPMQIPAGAFDVCPSMRVEMAQVYPSLSMEAFQNQVISVRSRYFPELKDIELHMSFFADASDYLRANLDFKTLFAEPARRSYRIEVNSRLLAAPPSPRALDAVLTHEIQHVRDYSEMSGWLLVIFGLKYSLFSIADYEHRTDEAVLLRGEGCSLLQYRLWLYAHERGRALEEKILDYYTPAAIVEWLQHHP
jgi:hypothetical protein